MVNIELQYQPFSILNYTRKIKGSFPSTFEELSPFQLIAIACLINSRISEINFLSAMTGFKMSTINKLEDYLRYALMNLFEPFTKPMPHHAFIIPHIKTTVGSILSPKPKLAGMTFGQFIFADSYFASYQNDKSEIDLHKFIGSLYLFPNRPFNENEIIASALLVRRIRPEILDAIVINYVLIKDWLALAYPMVFTRNEDNEEKTTPHIHKKTNGNSSWIKIFENMVGDDIINQDRYAILPLHTVLRWMTTKIKENMKRK